MLPDFLVKPAGAISTFVKANSPVILTVTSVVGVISTAVLAAKATPTALDLIADEKREQLRSEEKLTGMQSTWGYAKRVLPVYAPAIVSGALTIASILLAHNVNATKQAVLLSAYTLSEKTFDEYRNVVREKVGEKKEEMIRSETHEKVIAANPPVESMIVDTKRGSSLCFDEFTGRYFYSDPMVIRNAVTVMNEKLLNGTEVQVTLNDFYLALDLPRVSQGDDFGWDIKDGKLNVRYDTALVPNNIIGVGGRPCLTVGYKVSYLGYYR